MDKGGYVFQETKSNLKEEVIISNNSMMIHYELNNKYPERLCDGTGKMSTLIMIHGWWKTKRVTWCSVDNM